MSKPQMRSGNSCFLTPMFALADSLSHVTSAAFT
jgi:hypothetical protein